MAVKPRGVIVLLGLILLAIGVTAGTLLAAEAQQQAPTTPKAAIQIVPVAANAADPNVIEAKLADGKTIVRTGTTGLNVVSVGVPVTLKGMATDPALKVEKYAWTLTKPTSSSAALKTANESVTKFTPDVSGIYKVDLVVSNAAGASPMASVQIRAGEYIGIEAGRCAQCHEQAAEWAETGHAKIFHEEINGGVEPAISHYGEGCLRCHTTGYNPGVENGGFAAVQKAAGWQFPALAGIQAGGQWEGVPQALRNVANIQCEVCHGPAKDHVEKGARMAASLANGVCNVCHAGGGHHIKGLEIEYAGHADEASEAFANINGPSRQACVRCHSGAGYVSFTKNPLEQASGDNSKGSIGCSVCHDPHSDANKFQLRIAGKPVAAAGVTKDFGLSTTCVECHNARQTPEAALTGSYAHYSAAGEMLSDIGGVAYGQTVPNSPHGMMVGFAPVKNPDPAAAEETPFLFGGATPGACVTCHMWPILSDAKDPNYMKVGEHSFSVKSPDGKFDYTAPCQSCHQGMSKFDMTAKADYDGNGQVEGVQEEVNGLLLTVQRALADSGLKPIQGNPYFDAAALAVASPSQRNAVYNYRFVRGPEGGEGKAAAMHNFKRSVALLQLSYKDLTGNDVPNATLMPAAAPAPAAAAPAQPAAAPAQPAAAPAQPAAAPAQPAAAPAQPAAAAPAGGPPSTPHATQGREQCAMCHTVGGPGVGAAGGMGIPANHQGRADATCSSCH